MFRTLLLAMLVFAAAGQTYAANFTADSSLIWVEDSSETSTDDETLLQESDDDPDFPEYDVALVI